MLSGMPSIPLSWAGNADYLSLSAKYHTSLNTGKGHVWATWLVTRTFIMCISLVVTELFRYTVWHNLVWGKKENVKFSILKVGYIFYSIHICVFLLIKTKLDVLNYVSRIVLSSPKKQQALYCNTLLYRGLWSLWLIVIANDVVKTILHSVTNCL